MHVLVCNCGSSSLKFALVDAATGNRPLGGIAERLGEENAHLSWKGAVAGDLALPSADHRAALAAVLDLLDGAGLAKPQAVGHRLVHGGEHFTAPAVIDETVLAAVQACNRLAPLHNPANLLGVAAAKAAFPDLPQVAVFDTAFHQTMPEHAWRYAVPDAWYRDHGVRRYGFHGTSHRYVAAAAARALGKPLADTALITAHLGNGCSAAAVLGGQSVDTTMGLTPLEGLVMGTRSGDVDPGLLAYIGEQTGLDLAGVTTALNRQSGLAGMSGGISDMRELRAAEAAGDQAAATAIRMFCYRLAKAIAALAVPLGRLDAVVFTGGIGEHAAPIRERTLGLLGILGLACEPNRNAEHGLHSAGRISPDGGGPTALVIPTDEEWQIAAETAQVLG